MTLYATHPLWNYAQFNYTPPDKGLTGNPNIDALITGYRWSEKNEVGQTVVSYSFLNSASVFVSNYSSAREPGARSYFADDVRTLTRSALDQIAQVCNLRFIEVADNSNECGVLRFGYSQVIEDNNAGAWAYGPSSSPRGGDVWINPSYADKQIASWGYTLGNMILHETLHALGLKHPFEGDGSYRITLNADDDIQANTVMSYTPALHSTRQWLSFWPQEPMVFDIEALQTLYGANAYESGNTHYPLTDSQFNGQLRTLWDSAGEDTLDASHVGSGVMIDLRPGHASDIGQSVSSSAEPYTQTLFLAVNTWIENVITSPYDDTIITNAQDNIVNALAGNDVIEGSAGNDLINGGDGNDTLVWAQSFDKFQVRYLNGQLHLLSPEGHTQTIQNIELFKFNLQSYDVQQLQQLITGSLSWSSDTIKFNSNATTPITRLSETLYRVNDGDTSYLVELNLSVNGLQVSKMTIKNLASFEIAELTLHATLGERSALEKVLLQTSSKGLWAYLLSSHDTLTLSPLADQIRSGAGDDWIFAMAGNDVIDSGTGNDLLDGGAGDDQLIGGAGNDCYVVDSQKDRITDSAGQDAIETNLSFLSLLSYKTIETLHYTGNLNAQLIGNALANEIRGGPGDDIIDGGVGQDKLIGGAGADIFRISTPLKNNVDTITDFVSGSDRLYLSVKIFTALKNDTHLSDNFSIDSPFDNNDYLIYNSTNDVLYYDSDGLGSKNEAIAIITGCTALNYTDIFLF